MTTVYLKCISVKCGDTSTYPFNLPLFKNSDFELAIQSPVTMLIGNNGVGKSSFLGGVSAAVGFGKLGGSLHHNIAETNSHYEDSIRLSWMPKVSNGLAQFALAMHIGRWAGVQRLRQGRRAALGVWARQRDETIADSCRDTW